MEEIIAGDTERRVRQERRVEPDRGSEGSKKIAGGGESIIRRDKR